MQRLVAVWSTVEIEHASFHLIHPKVGTPSLQGPAAPNWPARVDRVYRDLYLVEQSEIRDTGASRVTPQQCCCVRAEINQPAGAQEGILPSHGGCDRADQ